MITIGKLAALAEVSADTLRYYEREGLGLAPWRRAFETAGGLVLIAAGLYLLNASLFLVPALAA